MFFQVHHVNAKMQTDKWSFIAQIPLDVMWVEIFCETLEETWNYKAALFINAGLNIWVGRFKLFHGSVCITVLESWFRYGSVFLGENYTVK